MKSVIMTITSERKWSFFKILAEAIFLGMSLQVYKEWGDGQGEIQTF